ncbi:cell wall-binding repeat-containing protein [Dethiobacter alkaliphilus]|uniref:Putative cell wall binding repeat 2-containing protein n=1 Tax=Dethiobacter alkaliphilus AHT 1 TaxID=555088 RepID=C0GFE7_DETAL|nr:cell wall-binding repeat-containing protein [Dethiobacter alkaliphilus]EEG77907.1 putative cell wall binding repeat 2-containing protein [Dethiobacter alkaliphilus AHT 1]
MSAERFINPGDLFLPWSTRNTTNTTRALGSDFSQTQYPVAEMAFAGISPVTVYLASSENFSEAIIGTPLMHHPIDGPLFLTDPNRIDPFVLAAIRRLAPTGMGEAQVVLIGEFSDLVMRAIQFMGFTVRRILGPDDVFHTAHRILNELCVPQDVFLISTDPNHGGHITGAYSAHSGVPILLTEGPTLPRHTRMALEQINNPRVYIVGTTNAIPQSVINEVQGLAGFVDVISADDIFTLAVRFSRYRSPVAEVGWDRNEPDGHAFTFVLPQPWQYLVSSASLAHLGKHTPFLFVNRDSVPEATMQYIMQVNPQSGDRPPFMHGFIIGNKNVISIPVQNELHLGLSVDLEHHMPHDL